MDDVKPPNRVPVPVTHADSTSDSMKPGKLSVSSRPPKPHIKSLDAIDPPRPVFHHEETHFETPAVEAPPEHVNAAAAPPPATTPAAVVPVNESPATPPAPESDLATAPGAKLEEVPHEESKPSHAHVTQAPITQPKKRGGLGMVVLISAVFAVALIVGASYAYLQHKKDNSTNVKTAATTTKTTAATPAQTNGPATTTDVDNLNSSIDNSMKKVDDTNDNKTSDLSDSTLGL